LEWSCQDIAVVVAVVVVVVVVVVAAAAGVVVSMSSLSSCAVSHLSDSGHTGDVRTPTCIQ